jgi:hypothetical protein
MDSRFDFTAGKEKRRGKVEGDGWGGLLRRSGGEEWGGEERERN